MNIHEKRINYPPYVPPALATRLSPHLWEAGGAHANLSLRPEGFCRRPRVRCQTWDSGRPATLSLPDGACSILQSLWPRGPSLRAPWLGVLPGLIPVGEDGGSRRQAGTGRLTPRPTGSWESHPVGQPVGPRLFPNDECVQLGAKIKLCTCMRGACVRVSWGLPLTTACSFWSSLETPRDLGGMAASPS